MDKELDSGKILCEQCGNDFKQVGNHWTKSNDCSHPELSDYKKEILIGLLMGDGTIGGKSAKNQYVQVEMISPNYLEYVDNKLGWLSTGIRSKQSAKENAKKSRDNGYNKNAKEENYSDLYILQTLSHPFITSLTEWYSSGSKVWPEDIELTQTVLKHWYCGDGYYSNKNRHNNIVISMANETDNTEKVSNYFTEVGLPEPSNYNIGESYCNAQWTVEDSQILWEYIGKPLPDFEYKWPEDMR